MRRRVQRRILTWAALALVAGPLVMACRMDPQDDAQPAADARTLPGSAEQVTIGDVQWYVDYAAAVEVARSLDLPLWVHFGENPG